MNSKTPRQRLEEIKAEYATLMHPPDWLNDRMAMLCIELVVESEEADRCKPLKEGTGTAEPTPMNPLPLVQGKLFIEYLYEQFPATVGHKAIIDWLTQVAQQLEMGENTIKLLTIERDLATSKANDLKGQLHYCNGTSCLAIKHRDIAEKQLKELRAHAENLYKCREIWDVTRRRFVDDYVKWRQKNAE